MTVAVGDIEAQPRKSSVASMKNKEQTDNWALPELVDDGPNFKSLSSKEKAKRVLVNAVKILILVVLLYLFICSLSFLSSAFRLVGGKSAGKIFQNNVVLSNPVAGVTIGVLATVLVQSSSTSTSIVVAMVTAGLLQVNNAVYIIMGANIGTSVTNTIVAVFHGADRNEFRRAFAAATVHDMFNWLCVICLLPLEVIVDAVTGQGVLYRVSSAVVGTGSVNETGLGKIDFLKKLTNPFTKKIIQIDKKVISALARGENVTGQTIAKHWCGKGEEKYWCDYLLNKNISDGVIGIILLVVSLVTLCVCLIAIVKLLHSMLRGPVAKAIRSTVNADFPGPFKYLTGYFAIVVGTIMTFLVQSSSIFTSTLTPLVAVGVLTLDRTYPLTLGANIGTTGTAMLAAFASDDLRNSLQIALCHLFFNIFGITIWYPLPFMRKVPINLAKHLGNTTAKYRWFAMVYLVSMFLLLPALTFTLSLAGWPVLVAVGIVLLLLLGLVVLVNVLQKWQPEILPKCLRTWDFLPEPLRSLEPYDRLAASCGHCCGIFHDNSNNMEDIGGGRNAGTSISYIKTDAEAYEMNGFSTRL